MNNDYKTAWKRQQDSEYTKQANDFIARRGITCNISDAGYEVISKDDKELSRFAGKRRNKYVFHLFRGDKSVSFDFTSSIHDSNLELGGKIRSLTPVAYDLLSCIQKYDVGSFHEFCGDFGYNNDSISAHKIYSDVCNEYIKVKSFFTNDELIDLQQIN